MPPNLLQLLWIAKESRPWLGKHGSSPPCLSTPLQPFPLPFPMSTLSASFTLLVPHTHHASLLPLCSPSLSIILPHFILYPENSCLSFKTHSNILPLGSLSLILAHNINHTES